MVTLSELKTARANAGEAYAAALDAFQTAFVTLAALDRTLSNRNVNVEHDIVQTFPLYHSSVANAVRLISHAEFAPSRVLHDWNTEIVDISNAQIAAFKPQ